MLRAHLHRESALGTGNDLTQRVGEGVSTKELAPTAMRRTYTSNIYIEQKLVSASLVYDKPLYDAKNGALTTGDSPSRSPSSDRRGGQLRPSLLFSDPPSSL